MFLANPFVWGSSPLRCKKLKAFFELQKIRGITIDALTGGGNLDWNRGVLFFFPPKK